MAKGRLSETLSPQQREELARTCAEAVVRAAHPLPVYVACSDPDVVEWATQLGASIVQCPTPGLDNAVTTARAHLREHGFDHVIVSHADLPLAHRLAHLAHPGIVTMVADRHRDGTNVLSFPLSSSFRTAYGPGSLDNHIQIAIHSQLPYEVIEDDSLALDLDTADDLAELHLRTHTTSTQRNPS